ncbi:MAG: type II CAAX endopeptidase family protein [Pseudomonadota bacterium]
MDKGIAAPGRAVRIWRHPGTKLIVTVPFIVATVTLLSVISHLIPPPHNGAVKIAIGALAAAMFVGMYVLFCRLIERGPARELALKGAGIELGAGILIGLGLFSSIVAAIWACGGYSVVGHHGVEVLPPVVAMALASGFPEEIVFRGLFFRLFEKWLGSWAALAITSAFFGGAHLFNPGATWLAAVAIALEAGIMLGAIYMITRRLWAAIGLHAAWNFAQGGIYGIAVSGGATDGLLVPGSTKGVSTLITGGSFGAEASLPAMVVATAFGLLLLVIAHRRSRFIAPMRVRARQGAGVQE